MTIEYLVEVSLLDLSVAQILHEKINKMFLPNMLRFIDVLSTIAFTKVCFILEHDLFKDVS